MVATSGGRARTEIDTLKEMIALFDKQTLRNMMIERCSAGLGGLTPLALLLSGHSDARDGYNKSVDKVDRVCDALDVLSSFSDGKDLEIVNAEGELPLHMVSEVQ